MSTYNGPTHSTWFWDSVGKAAKGVGLGVAGVGALSMYGVGTMGMNIGRGIYGALPERKTIENGLDLAGFAMRTGEKAARPGNVKLVKDVAEHMSGLVKYTPAHNSYNTWRNKIERKGADLKLTGRGKMLAVAGALMMGADGMMGQIEQRNVGSVMERAQTMTPSTVVPQYEFNPPKYMTDHAGATGDLVFALNVLR